MFLSNASIRRPIAMSCAIIALSLLGFMALREMGLELLPKMDAPMITVTTVYPGASPEQIETDVAKRIEDQVLSLDGLKHVSSTCMENVCLTFLEFNMEVDVDIAATDVREKIDLVRGDFPDGVEDPMVAKFDVNATPVVRLALAGDVPLDELFDYADNTLKDRITTIAGVAECKLIGGARREVHVVLDRRRLAARGLSSMDVAQAVRQSIGKIPAGRILDRGSEYSVEYDGDFRTVGELNDLEIASREGMRCYLKDVGRAAMATEELRQKASVNGQSCIAIEVVKKAEANAVQVVRTVRTTMNRLREELPGGMELVWVQDDGRFIEASVDSAWINILEGIVLTAMILFFFLYNFRSTLVVSVTMPLTIVIGLFFMQYLGYTLNMSTLIAIGMSVGILVMNSIVVLEAIVKHLDSGLTPRQAAARGAREAWIPVLASASTNVVVLFPIAMVGGLVGPFLRPLVLTMLILTVASLFISFTLTPMLCATILRPRSEHRHGAVARLEAGWNRGLRFAVKRYRLLLQLMERRRWVAGLLLAGVVGLLVLSVNVAGRVGGSFFPEPDKGEITVRLEFPTYYSLDRTESRVREAEERIEDLPELKSRLVTIGKIQGIAGQASEGVYLAQIQLKFSERDERAISIEDLLGLTRGRFSDYTDCIVGVFIPSLIGGINTPIQLFLAGSDLKTLDELAEGIRANLDSRPGYSDIDTSVREGKPKLRISPRRAVLADLGMPAAAFGMALRGNLEGLEAGTYKRGDRNYDIVVKLAEEEGKAQVHEFLFPGHPGRPLLIGALGRVEETISPIQILRRDKRRVSRVTGNTAMGLPLGTAVARVTELLRDGRLPPGYDFAFAGDVEYMAEAQRELSRAALTALMLVVLCLAAIMESWRQPALILAAVPLGLIGTIWALFMFGYSFSVFVIMGAVMLIGIVVNNAILIVDRFNEHVREGESPHHAMIQSAVDKFRPIVMITVAGVLGMLPLALGGGIGAELRNAVGMASVGGILVSGILTMLVVPVLYDFFTRRKRGKPISEGQLAKAVTVVAVGFGLFGAPPLARGQVTPSLSRVKALPDTTSTNLLTLVQAKRIALERNPGLKASGTRVEAAAAVIRQARASYFPILSLGGRARHNEAVPSMLGGGNPFQHYTAQAHVRWLIFDGFTRRFTLLAAKHGKKAIAAADRDARRLLVQAVAEAYFGALLALEQSQVAERDAAFNADLFAETTKRHEAGMASRSDVLNFKMRTMRAQNVLVVIQLDYQIARTALAKLLGREEADLAIELDPSAADHAGRSVPIPDRAVARAWANRPDLQQLAYSTRVGEAAVKAQRGAFWPKLEARAGYGLNRAVDSAVFNEEEDVESFASIAGKWDLWVGGSRKAQVDQVRAQTDAFAWQLEDGRMAVAAEVQDAIHGIRSSRSALLTQREISAMSDEIRDIVLREYEEGLAALTRLNEVQTDAVRAAGNLAVARIELARSFEALEAATAQNLEDLAVLPR